MTVVRVFRVVRGLKFGGRFGGGAYLKGETLKVDLNCQKVSIYVHLITAGKDPRMRKEVS